MTATNCCSHRLGEERWDKKDAHWSSRPSHGDDSFEHIVASERHIWNWFRLHTENERNETKKREKPSDTIRHSVSPLSSSVGWYHFPLLRRLETYTLSLSRDYPSISFFVLTVKHGKETGVRERVSFERVHHRCDFLFLSFRHRVLKLIIPWSRNSTNSKSRKTLVISFWVSVMISPRLLYWMKVWTKSHKMHLQLRKVTDPSLPSMFTGSWISFRPQMGWNAGCFAGKRCTICSDRYILRYCWRSTRRNLLHCLVMIDADLREGPFSFSFSGHQTQPPLNVKCCAPRAKMLWKTPSKVSVTMSKQLAKLISTWMRSSVKRSNQNRIILLYS